MIYSLRGVLTQKTAVSAVIEVSGVGYLVGMSSHSLSDLPALGREVAVYTFMSVREDAVSLFGFTTPEERSMFEKLIGVSGVGPKVALSALSTFSPAQLTEVIQAGDIPRVSTISGIGKKTAQRIVLELKGALDFSEESASKGQSPTSDIADALISMGFTGTEVALALKGFDGDDVDSGIRFALKKLGAKS